MQIVSSTLAGAALGSLSGGSLSDNLGRRMGLIIAAVPMLIGPLLSAQAQVGLVHRPQSAFKRSCSFTASLHPRWLPPPCRD